MRKRILGIVAMLLIATMTLAETIKVGMLTPLSGPIAIYGQTTLNGIKLATEELNKKGGIKGNKIELIIEDNKGDAAEAVNAVKKMISVNKIKALLGPVISTNSLAVAPIMQENKIPMLTPTGTNSTITQVGDYIARTCFIDEFQGQVMGAFAIKNLKAKNAVILTDVNSDYSEGLAEEFKKVFEANGGKILDTVSYVANDVDFTSQLTKIKMKKPEVIFVPGYYSEVSLIVKQARELRIDSVFLGGDGWDNGKLFEIAGDSINGSYISTHFSSESEDQQIKSFLKNYKARFGEEPSVLSALGYDAANVMYAAMERTENLDSTEIKNEVNKTKDFKGITGVISLDENRNAVKSAFVLEAKDGKFKYKATVDPINESEEVTKIVKKTTEKKEESKKKKSNNTVLIIGILIAGIVGITLINKKK